MHLALFPSIPKKPFFAGFWKIPFSFGRGGGWAHILQLSLSHFLSRQKKQLSRSKYGSKVVLKFIVLKTIRRKNKTAPFEHFLHFQSNFSTMSCWNSVSCFFPAARVGLTPAMHQCRPISRGNKSNSKTFLPFQKLPKCSHFVYQLSIYWVFSDNNLDWQLFLHLRLLLSQKCATILTLPSGNSVLSLSRSLFPPPFSMGEDWLM